MSTVLGKAGHAFTCNFNAMSWVELLPHSLPYTLKSLMCINPLCPDSFGWDGAFFFFFFNMTKQEKVKTTNSLSVDHIATFVANDFLFYFQLLCASINHIICLCLNFLSAKGASTLATFSAKIVLRINELTFKSTSV